MPRLSRSSSSHGGGSHSAGHTPGGGAAESLSGEASAASIRPASECVIQRRSAGGSGRMAIVAAERGSSCTDACAARASGGTCDEFLGGVVWTSLPFNQCESLRGAFQVGCMRGCEESEGADQPAFVSPRAPESHKPGVCLVNTLGKMSCEGSHPMTWAAQGRTTRAQPNTICACRSE